MTKTHLVKCTCCGSYQYVNYGSRPSFYYLFCNQCSDDRTFTNVAVRQDCLPNNRSGVQYNNQTNKYLCDGCNKICASRRANKILSKSFFTNKYHIHQINTYCRTCKTKKYFSPITEQRLQQLMNKSRNSNSIASISVQRSVQSGAPVDPEPIENRLIQLSRINPKSLSNFLSDNYTPY